MRPLHIFHHGSRYREDGYGYGGHRRGFTTGSKRVAKRSHSCVEDDEVTSSKRARTFITADARTEYGSSGSSSAFGVDEHNYRHYGTGLDVDETAATHSGRGMDLVDDESPGPPINQPVMAASIDKPADPWDEADSWVGFSSVY